MNTGQQSTLTEIELALQAISEYLPGVLGTVGIFYPPAMALSKFLPLLAVAVQGVDIVAKATGAVNPTVASAAVIDHLTPGQPTAPALSQ